MWLHDWVTCHNITSRGAELEDLDFLEGKLLCSLSFFIVFDCSLFRSLGLFIFTPLSFIFALNITALVCFRRKYFFDHLYWLAFIVLWRSYYANYIIAWDCIMRIILWACIIQIRIALCGPHYRITLWDCIVGLYYATSWDCNVQLALWRLHLAYSILFHCADSILLHCADSILLHYVDLILHILSYSIMRISLCGMCSTYYILLLDADSILCIPSYSIVQIWLYGFYYTDSIMWILLCRFSCADYIMRSHQKISLYGFNCGITLWDFIMQIVPCGLYHADCIVRFVPCGLLCADCIIQIASYGLYRVDCLVQIVLYKLHHADCIIYIQFHCADLIMWI